MATLVNVSRQLLPRSHSRKDSASTWDSSATPYSIKYPPIALASQIRERATSRSFFFGSVDSEGETRLFCEIYPKPYVDRHTNDLCLELVHHVNSESLTICKAALEAILDLITAFPYLRTIFQNVGADVAFDGVFRDAAPKVKLIVLDDRTVFLLLQGYLAIFPSDLNVVSRRMHYSRASHANADKSDLDWNFRELLRFCQFLRHEKYGPEAALAARYLRYIIFDKQDMKTTLWRNAKQAPDAPSQVIMELIDQELAKVVPLVRLGDLFVEEADALFEAALSLMHIQLEHTRKAPTALADAIQRRHSIFPKSTPLALTLRKQLRAMRPRLFAGRARSIPAGLGSQIEDSNDYGDSLVISEPSLVYDIPSTFRWMSERTHHVNLKNTSPTAYRLPVRSRTL